MATTPMPYRWKFSTLRASGVDGVGGLAHYFTEEAQSLYLKDGIASKELFVTDGRWEDATAGSEVDFDTEEYTQMSWTHPATGSLYGTAIIPDDDSIILYLLKYNYCKDIGEMIQTGNYQAQTDNPITQINAEVKNWNTDVFVKNETLFMPGSKISLGIAMGDSNIYAIAQNYLDQIDFGYNKPTVSISGRNRVGVMISVPTINLKGSMTDTVTNLCAWVLDTLGVDNYIIEENDMEFTLEYSPSDTGMKILDTISDLASGFDPGTDWGIEEMPDGTIIIGYNAFRASYLPKSVFKFTNDELFKRSSVKSVDGAYTKVYVTGKTSNGVELEPVVREITQWKHWRLPGNKTYFAPMLENTTTEEMVRYAKTLAKQLKRTGVTESYRSNMKPQLLVGDYATAEEKDIGVINQITHTFGERGFFTDFTADSGGDKQSILTRSANDDKVYTSSRRNGGMNRNRRLIDFIRNTTNDMIRASGAGSGGSSASGVQDVLVDGESVVEENVANIDLTGKQDLLTPDDRISINNNTISASIAPFSIVDGKICITYKEEI